MQEVYVILQIRVDGGVTKTMSLHTLRKIALKEYNKLLSSNQEEFLYLLTVCEISKDHANFIQKNHG